MRTPRAADDAEPRNSYARPDGVSLFDKVQFFQWACEQRQLEAADMNVLRVVLFTILGLGDGKPHNGWCTANKYWWVCADCCNDFKEIFKWTLSGS